MKRAGIVFFTVVITGFYGCRSRHTPTTDYRRETGWHAIQIGDCAPDVISKVGPPASGYETAALIWYYNRGGKIIFEKPSKDEVMQVAEIHYPAP